MSRDIFFRKIKLSFRGAQCTIRSHKSTNLEMKFDERNNKTIYHCRSVSLSNSSSGRKQVSFSSWLDAKLESKINHHSISAQVENYNEFSLSPSNKIQVLSTELEIRSKFQWQIVEFKSICKAKARIKYQSKTEILYSKKVEFIFPRICIIDSFFYLFSGNVVLNVNLFFLRERPLIVLEITQKFKTPLVAFL
jgi:hypothetical protein